MSPEENKAVVRRILEGWNDHSLSTMEALVDEFITADYVLHDPGIPDLLPGPEGLKQFARSALEGMPDIRITVQDLFAEEDRVAARFIIHSTDASTGKPQSIQGISISRFVNGKIAEEWQLGVPNVGWE